MKPAKAPTAGRRRLARVEEDPARSHPRAAARSGDVRAAGGERSIRNRDPDLKVLVTLLRRLHGWSQVEMAVRAAVHRSSVCLYESGAQVPLPATVEKLAGAAGVPMWVVEGVLLPAIALARESSLAMPLLAADGELALAALEEESARAATRLGVARLLAAPAGRGGDGPAVAADPGVPGADPWAFLPAWALEQSAEGHSLTAELAHRLRDDLERSRHDPRPFAPPRRASGRLKGRRRRSPSSQG
jgi:transcriptional regulator with XRE-family HTH domain